MPDLKLGKRPHRADARVPHMTEATQGRLPSPPKTGVNWYANSPAGGWGMLGNDGYGDCVQAGAMHCLEQFSCYAGNPLVATEQETLALYSAITGFDPKDPNTDQGTYVLGHGGLIEYWAKHGITIGGVNNKVTGFLQITHKDPKRWQQGIWIFGGLLLGFSVPESLMRADTIPYVWEDFSGPSAGGHEIWINGYEVTPAGTTYDLISWGQRYRATEQFLLNLMDEAVVVVDPAEMNARGVNAAGLSTAQLLTDMWVLRQGNA